MAQSISIEMPLQNGAKEIEILSIYKHPVDIIS